MKIRLFQPPDAQAASALCLRAFKQAVAPSLADHGVQTFVTVAQPDGFLQRLQAGHVILVAERDGNIIGVGELKQGRHVAMLFVEPAVQRQGIGRALMDALLATAHAATVTVSASLPSVAAYQHYGFALAGNVAESQGLVYQPMEYLRRSVSG